MNEYTFSPEMLADWKVYTASWDGIAAFLKKYKTHPFCKGVRRELAAQRRETRRVARLLGNSFAAYRDAEIARLFAETYA